MESVVKKKVVSKNHHPSSRDETFLLNTRNTCIIKNNKIQTSIVIPKIINLSHYHWSSECFPKQNHTN